MGWIIFGVWLLLAIFANMFIALERNAKTAREKKRTKIGVVIVMWIGVVLLTAGVLFILGWIWYYLCGGLLIKCEDSFFWKAIWGLATLIPFGFIVGLIAICCGWNPKDYWW